MATRVRWVDQVRALAMILIVLGHSLGQTGGEGGTVYNWLYLFHVPLCVVLSGFLFSPRNTLSDGKRYVKKVLLHEYVPYLIWGAISIVVYLVLMCRNNSAIKIGGGYAIGLLYGNGSLGRSSTSSGLMVWNSPMWYLPFIVATEILACAISKLLNKISSKVVLLLAVCVGMLSYYLLRLHSLFMELETVIYLFPFFVFGFLLKDIDFLKHRCNPVVGIMLVFAGSVLGKFNGAPGYLSDTYNNYLLFLVSASCICIGIISLVQYAEIKCSTVEYIGKNTLAILVAHKFPIMFCSIILSSVLHISIENEAVSFIAGTVVAAISIAGCLIVGRIMERICPVLIGKSTNS